MAPHESLISGVRRTAALKVWLVLLFSWIRLFPFVCYCRSSITFLNRTTKKFTTRGESRAAAKSKMERFVTVVNGCKPLIIITKRSILDVAAALDPPLTTVPVFKFRRPFLCLRKFYGEREQYLNLNIALWRPMKI